MSSLEFPETPSSVALAAPAHGGDLHRAALRFDIPLDQWLDLSAALNPVPYPLAPIDIAGSHRLPSDLSTLINVARGYYGAKHLVALPGSQAAIQWLPLLRPRSTVAVPAIGYREHWFRWQWSGHRVVTYDPADADAIDALLGDRNAPVEVLLVINPNNPTGDRMDAGRLLGWWQQLHKRGGWLIVDEAFGDTEPALSLAPASDRAGLVVLRSLGKFFGLPGIRCGFALCDAALAERLAVAVGPWPLSDSSVQAALQALGDHAWQRAARARLHNDAELNRAALRAAFPGVRMNGTDLFSTLRMPAARALQVQTQLASRGVWTRLIDVDAMQREGVGELSAEKKSAEARVKGEADRVSLLRFGLVDPAAEADWVRYRSALAACGSDQ